MVPTCRNEVIVCTLVDKALTFSIDTVLICYDTVKNAIEKIVTDIQSSNAMNCALFFFAKQTTAVRYAAFFFLS